MRPVGVISLPGSVRWNRPFVWLMSERVIVVSLLLLMLSGCTCGPGPDDPLVAASRQGDLREVEARLKLRHPVDRRNPIGETALMAAASSGHTAVVDLLLGEGADVNARDNYDKTALEGA